MGNRNRTMVLNGDYKPSSEFAVQLVSTFLSKLVRESFSEASCNDPLLNFLLPKSSLPNLQLIMCKNDTKATGSIFFTITFPFGILLDSIVPKKNYWRPYTLERPAF